MASDTPIGPQHSHWSELNLIQEKDLELFKKLALEELLQFVNHSSAPKNLKDQCASILFPLLAQKKFLEE